MSKIFEQFKKQYANLEQSNINLIKKLVSSHPLLFLQMNNGNYDFSRSPWSDLDNKTLADFKALAIYQKISSQLLPVMYPGIDITPGKFILFEQLSSPKKLNPTQLSQAVDSIKAMTDNMLKETKDNISGFEAFFNFLKSCLNFLITIITFGQKQNFFETTTHHLDRIKQLHEQMHMSFENLTEEEKVIELDSPVNNVGVV